MSTADSEQIAWLATIARAPARVISVARNSAGVGRIVVDVAGHLLCDTFHAAGQFAAVGPLDAEARFFAVACDPRLDGTAEFLVAPGQATADALLRAVPGDLLGVSGAIGTGYPSEYINFHDVVVVAAGTGIASLRPVVAAVTRGELQPRSARVYYGVRRNIDLQFAEDFDSWRQAGIELATVVQDDNSELGGIVTDRLQRDLDAALRDGQPPATAHYLVCGPDPMQRAVLELLTARGVAAQQVHFNY
jgi:NAD(P)H-flavin reductase